VYLDDYDFRADLNLAQRARCAAAIFLRDAADIIRLGDAALAFPLTLAQRTL
jgi:hypothetical protein